MRVFAGLPLPLPVLDRLALLRLRLAGPKDGLRWLGSEQWHITLRFFGEVAAEAVPDLVRAVGELRSPPPRLRIEQLGSFPAKGILFADVLDMDQLSALQAQVHDVAARCGVLAETRPFHPHITLARSRNPAGLAVIRRMTTPEPPPFGPSLSWVANSLWLYESDLQAGGAQYRTLADVPLRADDSLDPGQGAGPRQI